MNPKDANLGPMQVRIAPGRLIHTGATSVHGEPDFRVSRFRAGVTGLGV